MKKFATVLEAFGMMLAFVSMCFDPIEAPLLAIPIFIGFGMLVVGIGIEALFFECEIEEFVKSGGIRDCTDDSIVWISYDENETEDTWKLKKK